MYLFQLRGEEILIHDVAQNCIPKIYMISQTDQVEREPFERSYLYLRVHMYSHLKAHSIQLGSWAEMIDDHVLNHLHSQFGVSKELFIYSHI